MPSAMNLFSLAPFGPFAAWWDAAIARVAEIGLGPTSVMAAETPDDFATNLIRSTAPHGVVVSRRPSAQLRALLAESGAPLLVGLDDPREGLFDLVVGHGHDVPAATHALADSYAAAMICAGLPKVLVIHADEARHNLAGVIGRIAEFCGLDVALDEARIAAPPDLAPAATEWWDGLDPSERAIADGALQAYASWIAGHGFGEITWDRRLFCCAADHTRNASAAIEIGDAAGALIAGPWIALPPGNWAASVTLAVSRDTSGHRFDVGIHASEQPGPLAAAGIVPDGRGLGSATMLFTIAPAFGQTVSLTVASTQPAPGGRFALGNVVLTPSPNAATGIPAELSTALSL